MEIATKIKIEKHTYTNKMTSRYVVKKYCAFGCPVYIVYNIQGSCMEKRVYFTLRTESGAIQEDYQNTDT